MSSPNDFLFNSDYEIDKIVYFYSGLVTPSSTGTATISHSLGFAPLIFGFWSDDANFSTSHSLTTATFLNPADYSVIYDSVSAEADTTKITLHQSFGTYRAIYVRLYGLMPSDVDVAVPATSDKAGTFIFNTDYNYRKLLTEGASALTVGGSGFFDPITIAHNLGYKPQVMAWLEIVVSGAPYSIYDLDFAELAHNDAPICGVMVNTSNVVFRPVTPQYGDSFKLHYRIYYDEQT